MLCRVFFRPSHACANQQSGVGYIPPVPGRGRSSAPRDCRLREYLTQRVSPLKDAAALPPVRGPSSQRSRTERPQIIIGTKTPMADRNRISDTPLTHCMLLSKHLPRRLMIETTSTGLSGSNLSVEFGLKVDSRGQFASPERHGRPRSRRERRPH